MANAVRIVIEAIDKTKVGLTTPIRNLKDLQSAVTKLGPAMKAMSLTAASAFALFAKSSFNAAEEMRKMNTMLSVATGSMVGAAKEMDFVARIADDLGLDLQQAAKGFAGIAAAANGTALEGQKVRDVYEGVSTAVAALTLSADDTRGVLTALTQIISKGTVSSDELKQQLGERLPGAFQIAARSMGITTEEMSKLLEQGKIIADDFLPGFAEELKKTFGPAAERASKSYTANVARLKNQFFLLSVTVGQELLPEMVALTGALSDFIKEGSNAEDATSGIVVIMRSLKNMMIGVMASFVIAGQAIGDFAAGSLNILEENARAIRKLLLQWRLLGVQIATAARDLEMMNFKDFDTQALAAGQTLRDMLSTFDDNTIPLGLSAAFQIEKFKDHLVETLELFNKFLTAGDKKPPPLAPSEPPPAIGSEGGEKPLDGAQQKYFDNLTNNYDKIFLSKKKFLLKEFLSEAENIDKIFGSRKEGDAALFSLAQILGSELNDLDAKSAEEKIARQQKISDLRFELGQAGLDAETEQAEILENLREQQYQNDLARIESLKLEEAEARELKAAAEKARANQARADAIAAAKKADDIQKHRERVFQQSLGNMASASAAFFGEQSGAYKAFAISEAIVNTYRGANQTLADPHLPFWMKAFAVSSIIASGLANVAQISGVAHGGIAEVPSDQTFLLKQGERVLSPDQNEDFTEFIGDGRGGGGGMMNLTINLDGQPLYSGISKASKDGRFTISARAVS